MSGLKRDDDGWLYWSGGRYYSEPPEAIKTWWAGKLSPGCNAKVHGNYSSGPCGKAPKHDPDANGRPTKCGTHCAAAVKRRKEKSAARYEEYKAKLAANAERNKISNELTGIVQRIAAGHNDPRALAADWVERATKAGLIRRGEE